ncbi:MAG: hypothetical protein Fur0010_28070 [Bdellovibrio sp.]
MIHVRIDSNKTHEIEIVLNQSTVQCSTAAYGASFLKILIPQLSEMTVLDQRNFVANASCVSVSLPTKDLAI